MRLRHLPAGTVGLIGLLNPVTGVQLGTSVAGETLTVQQLCGLVLLLAGVVLGQPKPAGRRDRSQVPPHAVADERSAQASSKRDAL
ncbi:EamA family transporter [Streptomyces roseifaciens]|uniref:EamA family transporter n=1 Tax=Streptomyces roseifaciens TaxID=1488406 RepID=UPI00099F668B|nr:EamA family transporter [Streptomyces roseifaciens]